MSRILSVKYYQVNEERWPEKAHERYQSISKKKKEKKARIWL